MDEQKTKESLDVLGKLYLTGQSLDAESPDPVAVIPPVQPGADPGSHGPAMRLVPTLSDAGTGCEVIALSDQRPGGGTKVDDHPQEIRIVEGSLQPEIVVLGNLPVLARPWLSQYARNIAESDGSVVVAHIDEADLDLELIAPAGNKVVPLEVLQTGGTGGDSDERLTACVQGLSHLGPSRPRRCLLHLELARIQVLPAWMLEVERWTVLTGADEAAVQATVRMVQELVSKRGNRSLPQVGVAIAGCGRDEALAVTGRINHALGRASEAHGDLAVELRDTMSRMVPLHQEVAGVFLFDEATRRALGRFLVGPCRGGSRQVASVPGETPSSVVEGFGSDETGSDEILSGGKPAVPATDSVGMPTAESTPLSDRHIGSPGPLNTVEAPSLQGKDDAAVSGGTDLVSLGGDRLAGALVLEARCPLDPDIQLALDRQGSLHLLLHVQGENPAPALARLLPIQQWAAQHLSLLRLTMRDRDFDDNAAPVAHLFTDQPRVGAELATYCGDAVRVHLLARVGTGTGTSWYCAELN